MFVRNKSVVAAAAFGREPSGKRAVFIQAVKKRYDDGERASAERSAAKAPVSAEHEQGDEYPESGVVALIAAIHKKRPPVLITAGVMYFRSVACGFIFLLYCIAAQGKSVTFSVRAI